MNLVLIILIAVSCTSKNHLDPIAVDNKEYMLNKGKPKKEMNTVIKFLGTTTFHFNTIKAGDTIIHKYYYKNIGNYPFTIFSATTTCGCTISHFNKQPLNIGKTDSITAIFISNIKMTGFQSKVVNVTGNSEVSPFLLTMYGMVK